ncbi:MAG: apolipoprotein N-acyltransferase [Bacteroidetes bacterium RIFCSPHIGHO2_02_FULL_44_7]|nr:MAG: apolipoprotein N-acyltransferase [Bacteroidetes bacterium RIFCSPHIGHO2_02_FULL_44_7]
MVISFPYTGSLIPLVFLAWIPLLLVENSILEANYRSGKVFIQSYITFFIFNIGSTWWVYNASGGGAALAIVLNSLLMTLTFQAYHLTKKHVGRKEGYISLIVFWIAFEYFHHNWEMSWTWLSMGNYFSLVPSWVQWYSYTGILGGTLWILVVNLMLYRIVQNRFFRKETWRIQTPLLWLTGIFLLLPIGISLLTYYTFEEEKHPYEVVALQPNIDPYNEKFVADIGSQLTKLVRLADQQVTSTTDLLVAPETAISLSFYEKDLTRLAFFDYIEQEKKRLYDVPWLIGASTVKMFNTKHSRASFPMASGPGFVEYYNSSLLLPEDNLPQFTHKSKLVPGVEIIPFSNYFPFLEDWAIDNGGTSVSLGIESEPKIMAAGKVRIAPVVCYESVYGDWVSGQCRKGAELICVITNDGWWGDTPGYKQHMSFSRLRAIENRRWVVRSANTGISCFINQRGDVLQATGWWVEASIKQEVNLNSNMTFYTQYGDVLGRSLGFLSVILLLFTFVKRFKKKYIR